VTRRQIKRRRLALNRKRCEVQNSGVSCVTFVSACCRNRGRRGDPCGRGALAGVITAVIHTKLRINNIIAGIVAMRKEKNDAPFRLRASLM
jgi:hypothetical protein